MNKKYLIFIVVFCLLIIILVLVFGKPKTQPVMLFSPLPSANIINSEGDKSLYKNNKFEIIFQQRYNLYLINILSSPFTEVKKEAESAFLGSLNISKEQACKLNVFVATSAGINPNEAGKQYPLSFCQVSQSSVPSPAPDLLILPSLYSLNATAVYPKPGTIEIGNTSNSIFITFDREIDPQFAVVSISPSIKNHPQVHSVSQKELIIVPDENWQNNNNYTITISAGLRSLDGKYQLKQNYQINYRTIQPSVPSYPPMGI